MGPWSFPIVAEARMAERLLEVERARLALAAATGQGSRGKRERPRPQTSPSSMRRLLFGASALALAGCLVLGGAVVGRPEMPTAARLAASPIRTRVAPAVVEGKAPGLPSSPCGVPTFGWIHGPTAWLIDATLLQAPIHLPVCPLP